MSYVKGCIFLIVTIWCGSLPSGVRAQAPEPRENLERRLEDLETRMNAMQQELIKLMAQVAANDSNRQTGISTLTNEKPGSSVRSTDAVPVPAAKTDQAQTSDKRLPESILAHSTPRLTERSILMPSATAVARTMPTIRCSRPQPIRAMSA